uniref:HTH psq-type domain-containing protein n=1 Tax=Ditylenchus dipsaci TaxID=166011 RepID=A0A915DBG9_9BILA
MSKKGARRNLKAEVKKNKVLIEEEKPDMLLDASIAQARKKDKTNCMEHLVFTTLILLSLLFTIGSVTAWYKYKSWSEYFQFLVKMMMAPSMFLANHVPKIFPASISVRLLHICRTKKRMVCAIRVLFTICLSILLVTLRKHEQGFTDELLTIVLFAITFACAQLSSCWVHKETVESSTVRNKRDDLNEESEETVESSTVKNKSNDLNDEERYPSIVDTLSTYLVPMDTSRRKKKIDLATKRAIIKRSSEGKSYKVLSEEFGLKKASVQSIIQNKTAILGAIDGGTEAKRARLKTGRHGNLEQALDDELLELWNGLRLQGEIGDGVELANYLNLDSDLATDGVLSLDELAEDVLTTEGNQSAADIDVDSDVEMEEAPITRLEAQRALRLVRQYVENNFANPELLRQSDALDEAFWQDGQRKKKQSSLNDFFKPLT